MNEGQKFGLGVSATTGGLVDGGLCPPVIVASHCASPRVRRGSPGQAGVPEVNQLVEVRRFREATAKKASVDGGRRPLASESSRM